MRALILGATGLVGHHCWRAWKRAPGWEVVGTSHSLSFPELVRLDIRDRAAAAALIQETRADLVLLTASNPYVDYCETHPEETRAINVDATLSVAETARRAGSTLVFFSTDYVFDGTAAPYREEDPVRPLNEYGRQKVAAERGIAALGRDHLILRVCGVFGWEIHRKNFVLQVVDRLRSGGTVQAAPELSYNPTYAADLPDVIRELFELGRRGLYHAVGEQEMNRLELARAAAKTFGLDERGIRSVPVASLGSPTKRPLRSSLDTSKLRGELKARLHPAPEALRRMRAEEVSWDRYAESLRRPAS